MIQMPINVSPQNVAIDTTKISETILEFTSCADYLSFYRHRIYDYDTGKMVMNASYNEDDFTPFGYNGNKIDRNWGANVLSNGKDYVHQIMLCQRSADGTKPVHDMPVLSGKVENSPLRNKIYVAKGITSIYPWGYNNGVYSPCDANGDSMIIKINGESHVIKSYTAEFTSTDDKVYGIIETVDEFSFDIPNSASYEVLSNFIISPQYFFSCRTTPTVELNPIIENDGIYVSGSYNQAQNSNIKYYTLKVYWSNNSGFWNTPDSNGSKTELVAETARIYSQNISHHFYDVFRHDSSYSHGTNDYYKVICEIVTQDDMSCAYDSRVIKVTPADYSGVIGNTLYEYNLSWDSDEGAVIHHLRGYGAGGTGVYGTYQLFRTDLDSNETVVLKPNWSYGDSGNIYGYDMTASTQGNYKYELFLFDENDEHKGAVVIPDIAENYNGEGNFPCNRIKTNESAYYITDLNLIKDSDLIYHPNHLDNKRLSFYCGDTWKFVGEIQDTTVTNNLDRMTHVGYGQYVSSTSTDVNYMSGTLSAMLCKLDCTNKEYIDNIALVRAWRKFITQKKPFLLKSQKGDVWIVNITDNPSTTYEEMYRGTPTIFSFSWAESYDINTLDIYNRNYGKNIIDTTQI